MRIGLISLGCPKNQVDAEMMLAALQEDGYIFKGWSRDKETAEKAATDEDTADKEKWDFDNDTVTEDITLYAGWKKDKAAEDDDDANTQITEEEEAGTQ